MDNRSRSLLLSRTRLGAQEPLVAKLVGEISHLERWLDSQSRVETARGEKTNLSLVPTIRTLLETRRKLLNSLEAQL